MKKYLKTLENKINALSNEINNYNNIDKSLNVEDIKEKHLLNVMDDIHSDEDLLDVMYRIRYKALDLAHEAIEIIEFIKYDN